MKIVLAAGMAGLVGPVRAAKVTELQTRPLAGFPGKVGTMILVEYAPGDVDPIHRHGASVFLYVLEGTPAASSDALVGLVVLGETPAISQWLAIGLIVCASIGAATTAKK